MYDFLLLLMFCFQCIIIMFDIEKQKKIDWIRCQSLISIRMETFFPIWQLASNSWPRLFDRPVITHAQTIKKLNFRGWCPGHAVGLFTLWTVNVNWSELILSSDKCCQLHPSLASLSLVSCAVSTLHRWWCLPKWKIHAHCLST